MVLGALAARELIFGWGGVGGTRTHNVDVTCFCLHVRNRYLCFLCLGLPEGHYTIQSKFLGSRMRRFSLGGLLCFVNSFVGI